MWIVVIRDSQELGDACSKVCLSNALLVTSILLATFILLAISVLLLPPFQRFPSTVPFRIASIVLLVILPQFPQLYFIPESRLSSIFLSLCNLSALALRSWWKAQIQHLVVWPISNSSSPRFQYGRCLVMSEGSRFRVRIQWKWILYHPVGCRLFSLGLVLADFGPFLCLCPVSLISIYEAMEMSYLCICLGI